MMTPHWTRAGIAVLVLLLVGYARGSSQTAVPAATSTRAERWRSDLRYFAKELPARHKKAYARMTKEAFGRAVAELDAEIPHLTDSQIQLRIAGLAAMVRDAHTHGQLPSYPERLPITVLWSEGGLYVTGAAEPFAMLVGRRIVTINGHSLTEVANALGRYLAHENEIGFYASAPSLLLYPGALCDIGLGTEKELVAVEVEGSTGERSRENLPSVPSAGFVIAPTFAQDPLYRRRANENHWFEYLADSKTVFVKYNRCLDSAGFRRLTRGVAGVLEQERPARVVVDVRHNPGGDSRIVGPLVRLLRSRQEINRPDALYVIIGRATASSGLMAAIDFRKKTRATIVGEPTGERPNHYGELKRFRLPNSNLEVSYSTKFFRLVDGDPEAFDPDVNVPPTTEALVAGRDPVMEWILAHPPGKAAWRHGPPNQSMERKEEREIGWGGLLPRAAGRRPGGHSPGPSSGGALSRNSLLFQGAGARRMSSRRLPRDLRSRGQR